MRKITTFNFIALLFIGLLGISAAAQNSSPTLLKRTVNISPKRSTRWWKTPTAAEPVYNTYSWVPQIQYTVLGAISPGSQMFAEFDTADGKPWIKYKMKTRELEDDVQDIVLIEDTMTDDELEKKGIVGEGVFPFRIRLKNAIAGTDRIMFSGKYRVATYTPDQKIPENKGKKEYYIDYDWQIPFGYLWLNPEVEQDVPQLAAATCFRGADSSESKIEAFLFYNGKQISKKTASAKETLNPYVETPYHWQMWQFTFDNVRGFNHQQSANDFSSQYYLDKNPGDYEIKVLRDNQLARVIKFTVGKDGKIVDNGIKDKNQLGGVRMIVPVSVVGAADGKWNMNAWKTEGLFGNLTGFTAIP